MSSVNITYELNNDISKLKEDTKRMTEIFEEIKKETQDVPNFWKGKVSEDSIANFNEFIKKFETITNESNERITFLENNVVESYGEFEKNVINATNETKK